MVYDNDWTPMIGLKRALLRLVVRSLITFVIWAGCVWAVTPVLNFLVMGWAIFAVVALVFLIPGVAIGHALARNLTEIAGMAALPLTAMAVLFGLAVVVFGEFAADAIRDLGDWQTGVILMATGAAASIWIIRATLLES